MTRCRVVLCLTGLLCMHGCSQADRFVRTTDSMVRLSAGVPYVQLQPAVVWHDGVQGVEVGIGCSNYSRVFFQDSTGFRSILEVSLRLVDRTSDRAIADHTWIDSTFVATYPQTRTMEIRRLSYFLPAPNAVYTLIASVTDRLSGKRLVQRQDIEVATDRFSIASGVIDTRRGSAAYAPLFVNQVAGRTDSVLVTVVVNTPRPGRFCEAGLRLVRYPADDSPAPPPHFYTAPLQSAGTRGVDYAHGDTVVSSDLEWITEDRQAEVSFPCGALPAGYYRAIVTLRIRREPRSPRARTLTLTRDVVAFSRSFPRVGRPEDFIDPIVYIASPGELDELRAAAREGDPMKRLREFWLAPSRNEAEAAQSMNIYYGRVEEANWFFSIHKEGWKTDQGMIYIVHGPPAAVTHDSPDTEVWHYPDRGIQYVFTRVRQKEDDPTLPEQYILVRPGSISAPREWLDAIREFRGGIVPFGLD
jgi:GWxTD domain-containing protein